MRLLTNSLLNEKPSPSPSPPQPRSLPRPNHVGRRVGAGSVRRDSAAGLHSTRSAPTPFGPPAPMPFAAAAAAPVAPAAPPLAAGCGASTLAVLRLTSRSMAASCWSILASSSVRTRFISCCVVACRSVSSRRSRASIDGAADPAAAAAPPLGARSRVTCDFQSSAIARSDARSGDAHGARNSAAEWRKSCSAAPPTAPPIPRMDARPVGHELAASPAERSSIEQPHSSVVLGSSADEHHEREHVGAESPTSLLA
mmetsp:Transcript_72972/g.200325  ORF Transcript_72972/g.200325 Transcript_72972/m.200325 type:complete len:255 (+) Transcript_72972:276-1040(+)